MCVAYSNIQVLTNVLTNQYDSDANVNMVSGDSVFHENVANPNFEETCQSTS